MKFNSQSNTILNDKTEKKSIKKTESIRLTDKTCDPDHEIRITQ